MSAESYNISSILSRANKAREHLKHNTNESVNDLAAHQARGLRHLSKSRTSNEALREMVNRPAARSSTSKTCDISSDEDDIDARPTTTRKRTGGGSYDLSKPPSKSDLKEERDAETLSKKEKRELDAFIVCDESVVERHAVSSSEDEPLMSCGDSDEEESSDEELDLAEMDIVDDLADELEHCDAHGDEQECSDDEEPTLLVNGKHYKVVSDSDADSDGPSFVVINVHSSGDEKSGTAEERAASIAERELDLADKIKAQQAAKAKSSRVERMRKRNAKAREAGAKIVAVSVAEMVAVLVDEITRGGAFDTVQELPLSKLVHNKTAAAYNAFLIARETIVAEAVGATHPTFADALRESRTFDVAGAKPSATCYFTGKKNVIKTISIELADSTSVQFSLSKLGFSVAYQLLICYQLTDFLRHALDKNSNSGLVVKQYASIFCRVLRQVCGREVDTENLVVRKDVI